MFKVDYPKVAKAR